MRGAFGKPLGTVARVNIGQTILSIRSKPQHKAACIEAFRRAKMKFPGRQKVCCGQKFLRPVFANQHLSSTTLLV
jgi:large subunit ribosomal protein L10e